MTRVVIFGVRVAANDWLELVQEREWETLEAANILDNSKYCLKREEEWSISWGATGPKRAF